MNPERSLCVGLGKDLRSVLGIFIDSRLRNRFRSSLWDINLDRLGDIMSANLRRALNDRQ